MNNVLENQENKTTIDENNYADYLKDQNKASSLLNNKIDRSERSKHRFQRYDIIKLSDKRRPIYAVLTEPMKSDVLKRQTDNLNLGGYLTESA